MTEIAFDSELANIKTTYFDKIIKVGSNIYKVIRISRELSGKIYFIVEDEKGQHSKQYFTRKLNSNNDGKA